MSIRTQIGEVHMITAFAFHQMEPVLCTILRHGQHIPQGCSSTDLNIIFFMDAVLEIFVLCATPFPIVSVFLDRDFILYQVESSIALRWARRVA